MSFNSPISGFMPIPLALMIPFMATQSIVMGEAFGKGFQYGKRKISAMSNEEFNKFELSQAISETFKAYKDAIPALKESIAQSSDLQNYIVSILIDMPRDLIDAWIHALHGHEPHPRDYKPEPGRFVPPIPGTGGKPTPAPRPGRGIGVSPTPPPKYVPPTQRPSPPKSIPKSTEQKLAEKMTSSQKGAMLRNLRTLEIKLTKTTKRLPVHGNRRISSMPNPAYTAIANQIAALRKITRWF